MPITPLPNPPSRTDPINFASRADDFVDALANSFVPEANALENSIIASVSSATSTTTHSMTLGAKTFTVQTGKSFATNSWLSIVSTTDVTKGMIARVTGYNTSTGELSVEVTAVTGTGSNSSWFLHFTFPQAILAAQAGLATTGANTFTGAQTLPGDATANLHAVPKQQLDSGLGTKANLAGNSGQTFNVGASTLSSHAIQRGQAFGLGQTWQDVRTSPGRFFGDTYINSTGKPIVVHIYYVGSGGSVGLSATINSVTFLTGVTAPINGAAGTSTVVVPPGATYSFAPGASATLLEWHELR